MTDTASFGQDVEAAIVSAARDVLARDGYRRFTVEAVADRAGVARASIDRRWPAVERLLADVLGDAVAIEDIPDLGDSRTELSIAVHRLIGRYTNRPGFDLVLLALAADCAADLELVEYLRQRCERWRAPVVAALHRAAVRGDLPPDVDTDLVVDLWAGAIAHRRVFEDSALDADVVGALLDLVMSALAPLRRPRPPSGRPPQDPWPWWLEEATAWLDGVVFGRVCQATDGVPMRALAAAPAYTATVAGHPVTVAVGLCRDFMPEITAHRDGLAALATVEAAGGGILPPFLQADLVAVLHGDDVWVAPLTEESPRWRTSRRFRATAGRGPKWEIGASVDVVVRLIAEHGAPQLVRVPGQRIEKVC